jgi:hypothetical protein
MPDKVTKVIHEKFRIKKRDTLPYTGWLKSTRHHIAELFNDLGYKYGAEIGVERGRNARMFFRNMRGLKLVAVDPWTAYNRMSKKNIDQNFEYCQARLKPYDVKYMKMTSMEAVGHIPDGSLDFVYIDGLHEFDPVIMDIVCWAPKVRRGGIIAGHDYYAHYKGGVMRAVNTYTRAHNINQWYITTAEMHPSWFWVQREQYQNNIPEWYTQWLLKK